jgi:citrate lyase alpha subunit
VQYSGYGAASPYGGFGGYYGFAIGNLSTPGYYTTNSKYFLEAKLFDLQTDDLLMSIQSMAQNPKAIEMSSKKYVETLVQTIKELNIRKK